MHHGSSSYLNLETHLSRYNGIMIKVYAKDKKFDAVRMMGEIQDKLSKRYSEYPEAERRDLLDIRREYRRHQYAKEKQ